MHKYGPWQVSDCNLWDRQDKLAVHVTSPATSSRCSMCQSTAALQHFEARWHEQHKLDINMGSALEDQAASGQYGSTLARLLNTVPLMQERH